MEEVEETKLLGEVVCYSIAEYIWMTYFKGTTFSAQKNYSLDKKDAESTQERCNLKLKPNHCTL